MANDRCLVIGGSGFLGSHLCKALVLQGAKVNILSRKVDSVSCAQYADLFCGSLQDVESLEAAIAGCSVVYHLGSSSIPSTSNLDPKRDIENNLKGAVNLLEASLKENVSKIIFASSGGTVYGVQPAMPISENSCTNPICSYGVVKLSIEKYLHMYFSLYGLDYCALRISNPFGEGQGLGRKQGAVSNFISKHLQGERVEIWGDGSIVRDYIYVGDVISAFLKAKDYTGTHKVFNIGTGVGRSILQILHSIEQTFNCSVERTYKPSRLLDVPKNILDIELAKKELDWQPVVSWEEALTRTYYYLKAECLK
ncbi:NAD-dependent epimerase/dehydratase family protein [Almyronema epifaneia]|uniref:NAD-dependent epimerase/dehydratase family protein n=1 Tax=Almyronema epifaneia S1 TaxID=2991925 RepID=A0ABW6IAP5_9CYAN